ncbi:MAG: hypothetical protein WBA41_09460 [Rivularia sp. (in: cyanobacteria)]
MESSSIGVNIVVKKQIHLLIEMNQYGSIIILLAEEYTLPLIHLNPFAAITSTALGLE